MQSVPIALWVVILLVVMALLFDFMNGFHDAANSIATVVSTGVLRPTQAVVFAAFFNLIAIFVFHLSVAATVGKGIVEPGVVDTHVVFGALSGAITWNIITWYYGIPSSSSHALIGGIVGAVIAKAGAGYLIASGVWRTVAFIFISPTLGSAFDVIDTLVHELVHAVDNCEHKHGREFKKIALKVGLVGPMRSAGAGPELKAKLTALLDQLGPYPHGQLKVSMQKAARRARPRAKCQKCGFQVPMLKKFLTYGPPICPKDIVAMEALGDWEDI